ncbi:hypothetical protein BH925_05110 [Rodentibacter pneumotropicus]|nr:hypothetical protein BH925_05110 [Rodentibacter pneumotropicus]
MNLQQIGLAVIGVVLVGGYVWHRLSQAKREIDRLLKTNATLSQEKAVAEAQVTNFKARKQNEENYRNTDRTSLIDGLHKSGDLRD